MNTKNLELLLLLFMSWKSSGIKFKVEFMALHLLNVKRNFLYLTKFKFQT